MKRKLGVCGGLCSELLTQVHPDKINAQAQTEDEHATQVPIAYSPPQVGRLWGMWGPYYNIPKAISYLLKGDYTMLSLAVGAMHCERICLTELKGWQFKRTSDADVSLFCSGLAVRQSLAALAEDAFKLARG